MKPFLSQSIPWQRYGYMLFNYARALFIIVLCLLAGNFVSTLLPIMIPGSILGLLLLFFLLSFQLIPSHWVKEGCNLFMRYMTILFIPAGMGIMDTYSLLFDHFLPIVIGCLASTIIVLLLIGYLTQYLHGRNNKVIK